MAGRPVFEKLCRDIATDAEQAGVTQEELLFARMLSGESPRKLMARYGVSRDMFYLWLGRDTSGERRRLYDEAKVLSADGHADLAGDVLEALADKGIPLSSEVQLASARSNYHRWLAECRDRVQFGKAQTATMQINIGSLHLDALRAAGSAPVLITHTEVASLPSSTLDAIVDADEVA
jgi:hypothetical protein